MKKKYVANIVGEEYKKWTTGKNITINCQTGKGKTYMILNKYANFYWDRNILFLVNRSKLSSQIYDEIVASDIHNVKVRTYQAVQEELLKSEFINTYDTIICDEFHYCINDSWNDKTDVFWKFITTECTKQTKIFMTATGDVVFNMLSKVMNIDYSYELESNYRYIEKVKFFKGNKLNTYPIEQLKKFKKKAIYFSASAEKAYNLHLLFKGTSSFICSKSNKKYGKYSEQDCIKDEKFNSKYLMATKVIDNGVNIKDKDVKNIIIDIMDSTTLIQCIGRKRILDRRDRLTLHIRNFNEKELLGKINGLQAQLDEADAYLFNHKEDKMDKDEKQIPTLCYVDKNTDKVMVNTLRYIYTKTQIEEFELMVNMGYSAYISMLLGIPSNKIEDVESSMEDKKEDELKQYLSAIVGEILTKEKKEELINMIGLRDNRNRLQKSLKLLNSYLEENKYKYEILSILKSINGYKQRVWIVGETE